MPSASTSICQQCCSQPSKYTCPLCKLRTCSLACTKLHKSSRPCSDSTLSTNSVTVGASTLSHNTLPQRQSGRKGSELGFIPIAEYGEQHLLKDYLFLSKIGRNVAEEGRKILSLNLPIPSNSSSSQPCSHAGNSANGAGRVTNQQRQREQLMKQLHYRRYKVMLLPEGMERRKLNSSWFSGKEKKLFLTVSIITPSQGDRGKEKEREGWVVGKVDSEKTIAEVVLDEVQFRSFASKKELGKARETLNLSNQEKTSWLVAREVLQKSGLPIPPSEEGEGKDWIVLQNLPQSWSIIVPIYSARLRNESTTKYLDWWNRKRRWEEMNPELAAQQQEEEEAKRQRAGEEGRVRKWGRTEANDEGKREAVAVSDEEKHLKEEVELEPTTELGEVGGGGIISNSLLSILSQRLGRSQSQLLTSADPTSPPVPASTTQPANTEKETVTNTIKSEEQNARSILVHIQSPSTTTLDWMLKSLPEGYSVVEFPEFRIIPTTKLANMEGVVELAPSPTANSDETSGEAGGKEVRNEAEVEKKDGKQGSTVTMINTNGGLGSFLADYDSSDDDDGEGDEEDEIPAKTGAGSKAKTEENQQDGAGSLATLASKHGFTSSTTTSQ